MGGDILEKFPQFGLNHFRIDVTDHNYCLKVRTIPCVIEILKFACREGLKVFLSTYDITGGIFRAFVEMLPSLLGTSPLGCAACTPLLYDDTSLLIYFDGIICHKSRVVVHYQKRRVDNAFPGSGYVVEHIHCLLNSCGCIDISTKTGSDALEIIDHHLAGEIFRAVECHMLKEVSKAVLGRSLLDSTNIGEKIIVGSFSGLVVVFDVIGQSVFKFAVSYGRVPFKHALRIDLCKRNECHEK